MKAKTPRNVKLYAEQSEHGMDILIDFSGHRSYLMTARFNKAAYDRFKGGVRLEALQRMCHKETGRMLHFSLHLLNVVEDYISYELAA